MEGWVDLGDRRWLSWCPVNSVMGISHIYSHIYGWLVVYKLFSAAVFQLTEFSMLLMHCTTLCNWWLVIVANVQAIGVLPDQAAVRALQRIAWSSCAAGLQLVHAPYDQIHQAMDQLHGCVIGGEGDRLVPEADDVAVCREALEVLSVCLALCPDAVDVLYRERVWQTFIIDVLLVCRNRLLLSHSGF